MTTTTDIANRALGALGTRTTMSAAEFTNQTSNESIQLNLIFNASRRALLRMAPWNCAKKTANLTYITSTPGTPENLTAATTLWAPGQPPPPWNYEYQYPADCLRPVSITPGTMTGFAGIPITNAVTGGAATSWNGPPVKYAVQTDTFYPVTAAAVATGGTGNAVGDVLTLATTPAGSAPIGAPAQLTVTTVSGGGVITGVSVVNSVGGVSLSPSGSTETIGGSYFAQQTNPVGVSASTGAGDNLATFTLTFGAAAPQRVVLTNQEFATFNYIQDITDPNIMDDQFQEAWVQVLSAGVASALTGNAKIAHERVQMANGIISLARVGDGNEGFTVNDVTPDWVQARGVDWIAPYSSPWSAFDWGALWPSYG